jgi:hypothetical protein
MPAKSQVFLFAVATALATSASSAEPVIHPRFNDLMTAVLYFDAAAVHELLEIGKYPDKPDSNGFTPLAAAIELGDTASAELLLKAGANPDKRAYNGKTPRTLAAQARDGRLVALLDRYAEAASTGPSGRR